MAGKPLTADEAKSSIGTIFYAFNQAYEAQNIGQRIFKPDFTVPLN